MNNNEKGYWDDVVRRAVESRAFRKALATSSHYLFARIYFPEAMFAPSAEFQKEMFRLAEKESRPLAVAAFRGSGKTFIFTQSYPLFAVMAQGIHFILIASATQRQSEAHLANIRYSLENNSLLNKDFGPLKQETDRYGRNSLIISKYDCKIMSVSTEQAIRGLKYKHWRPQILIGDDLEDINSVRTQESRDKIFHYLQSEIIPLGGPGTRLIIVGNLLHPDSTMMRLKDAIEKKKIDGVFRKYPLQDEDGNILWLERFTPEVLAAERNKVMDEIDWEREMNLRFIFASDTVVRPEWIHHYKKMPDGGFVREFVIGVDPAIGQRESNCFTSIVSVVVANRGDETKLYVYPDPFNKRVNFPDTIDEIQRRYEHLATGMRPVKIFIEDVAYQSSLAQHMQLIAKLPAKGSKMPMDPRGRYSVVGDLCRREKIVFPETGCELLITQLTGFGKGERFHDLASALALIAFEVFPDPYPKIMVPSVMSWPGKRLREFAADDSEIREMLRDPERRKELEHQADLEATDEQLKARGLPGHFGGGRSGGWRRKEGDDYPRKFTF